MCLNLSNEVDQKVLAMVEMLTQNRTVFTAFDVTQFLREQERCHFADHDEIKRAVHDCFQEQYMPADYLSETREIVGRPGIIPPLVYYPLEKMADDHPKVVKVGTPYQSDPASNDADDTYDIHMQPGAVATAIPATKIIQRRTTARSCLDMPKSFVLQTTRSNNTVKVSVDGLEVDTLTTNNKEGRVRIVVKPGDYSICVNTTHNRIDATRIGS